MASAIEVWEKGHLFVVQISTVKPELACALVRPRKTCGGPPADGETLDITWRTFTRPQNLILAHIKANKKRNYFLKNFK